MFVEHNLARQADNMSLIQLIVAYAYIQVIRYIKKQRYIVILLNVPSFKQSDERNSYSKIHVDSVRCSVG